MFAGAVLALLYAIHRLALWADSNGWIYYKTKPKFRGSSLGLIEAVYNPAIEHVVEERGGERARGSQDDSGDDDPPNLNEADRGMPDRAETSDSPGSG